MDTTDSAVLWLNITNFVMAGVMAVCFIVLGVAIARELMLRLRHRVNALDGHAFQVPELGMTMADGGEREDGKNEAKSPRVRR